MTISEGKLQWPLNFLQLYTQQRHEGLQTGDLPKGKERKTEEEERGTEQRGKLDTLIIPVIGSMSDLL